MSLWEALHQGLEKAAQEAEHIAREHHIHSTLPRLAEQVTTYEEELLKRTMQLYTSGALTQGELIPLCEGLASLHQEVTTLRQELSQLEHHEPVPSEPVAPDPLLSYSSPSQVPNDPYSTPTRPVPDDPYTTPQSAYPPAYIEKTVVDIPPPPPAENMPSPYPLEPTVPATISATPLPPGTTFTVSPQGTLVTSGVTLPPGTTLIVGPQGTLVRTSGIQPVLHPPVHHRASHAKPADSDPAPVSTDEETEHPAARHKKTARLEPPAEKAASPSTESGGN